MGKYCAMCGAKMPEGGQVCLRCMKKNGWLLIGELVAQETYKEMTK